MNKTDFAEAYRLLREKMREKLLASDSCHDFDHTLRVVHNAETLLAFYPQAEREIVRFAALLHDIARPEESASGGKLCHAALGAEMVLPLLREAGLPEQMAQAVSRAVRTHRFRLAERPETLEAKIVYDADKLDSLGAVGIGRAFLFAGHCNARLHNSEAEALAGAAYGKEDTAYREYLVKLRKLPECMCTEAGRRMASERLTVMDEFFRRLTQEISG